MFLTGCPTTVTCDADETFDGTNCVPFDGGNVDAGSDGAMEDPDVPCGGCAAGVCDVISGDCVECLGDDATTCTVDGENACVGNECVACDSSDDCTSLTAPECNGSNACVPCTGPEACEGRTGTTVCDVAGDGACVECVTNADCGTGEGCVPETHTCRNFVPRDASLCGDCVADEECPVGQLCIPMMYDDPATTAADPVFAGNHCLWRSDASGPGPGGACSTIRPYVATRSVTSVDDVTTNVCVLAVSTCEAHEDFRDSEMPCTLDATGDALCGREGVPDAVCRMLDAAANLCTVYCVSDTDCRAGVTCDTGVSPGQCRL
jgi:hypothetical protein